MKRRGIGPALVLALGSLPIALPANAQGYPERVDCPETITAETAFGGETYCVLPAGSETPLLREAGGAMDIPFVAEFGGQGLPYLRVQFASTDPLLVHDAVDMTCQRPGFLSFASCLYSLGGGGFAGIDYLMGRPAQLIAIPSATEGLDKPRGAQLRFGEGPWIDMAPAKDTDHHAFSVESSVLVEGLEADPPFIETRHWLTGAAPPVTSRFSTRFVAAAGWIADSWADRSPDTSDLLSNIKFDTPSGPSPDPARPKD